MGWGLAKWLLKRECIAMFVLLLMARPFDFVLFDFRFFC